MTADVAPSVGPRGALSDLDVRTHVHERLGDAWAPTAIHSVTERTGGNLNVVFLVEGAAGKVIVKQGLPYVRIAADWAVPASRTVREADFYRGWGRSEPGAVPAVIDLDVEKHILVMEYLDECEVWRDSLCAGRLYAHSAQQVGETLGAITFGTSRLSLDAREFDIALAGASNPELESMMEDVLFRQPWIDHPRNEVPADVEGAVEALRVRPDFRVAVQRAHRSYLFSKEVLAHGDLHTGSIMVSDGRPRVFDGEFAHYAPAALDLGLLWGNIALAAIGAEYRSGNAAGVWAMIEDVWAGYTNAVRVRTQEQHRFGDLFVEKWLDDIWRLARVFAGIEIGRRVIGLGTPEDIESLSGASKSGARRTAIAECREWVTCDAETLGEVVAQSIGRLRSK